MTPEEKLKAYETMQAAIQAQYEDAAAKMEALKAQGKEKTVTFRTLFGQKVLYKEMLSIYKVYGL
ncbi:MAG: hypothetical protein Q4F17_06060 [Eubacteriales bacterium]|nr:hypothetical protein [Eubacteriales bacterium]